MKHEEPRFKIGDLVNVPKSTQVGPWCIVGLADSSPFMGYWLTHPSLVGHYYVNETEVSLANPFPAPNPQLELF